MMFQHAEPTNGVTLNYSLDNTTHSSQYSQHVKSRETTPETREKKKSSGLVSWIKRKFAKVSFATHLQFFAKVVAPI